MISKRRRRIRFRRPGRAKSWAVCGVLIVSLWRAPVPWIHSHESLKAQGLPEASLIRHLHHLHHGADGSEAESLGWHIHLTWPWEMFTEPCGHPDPQAPAPRTVYDMPYVVAQALSAPDMDRSGGTSPLPGLCLDRAHLQPHEMLSPCVPGRHFLATYAPSVALRALICVARC